MRPRRVLLPLVALLVAAVAPASALVPSDVATEGRTASTVPTEANVSVTVETMPGDRPLPTTADDLVRLRASGNLTEATRIATVDTMVVTLSAPNLTGRLARYEGSSQRRLRTFLARTPAAFRILQTNPGTELAAQEMYVTSAEAARDGSVTVFPGPDSGSLSLAIDLSDVPVGPDYASSRSEVRDDLVRHYRLYDGDRYAVGFTLSHGSVTGEGDSEFDPGDVFDADENDSLTREQVTEVTLRDPEVTPLPTALDPDGEPTVRYAAGADEPVPLSTPLAPGSRLSVAVRYGPEAPTPNETVRRVVRVDRRIDAVYPSGSRAPGWGASDGEQFLVSSTWDFPDAAEPYEVTLSVNRSDTRVEIEAAAGQTVAPARASLDVPRQRGDGDTVFVRNVSLSHGGLLVLVDEAGSPLASLALPAGVHGREFVAVPAGVDVPREPRVVAYRDLDLDGAPGSMDVPYRVDGTAVAATGEYVTPTPTTPTATATPTPTPTTTSESLPGFGATAALAGLSSLVALTVMRREK